MERSIISDAELYCRCDPEEERFYSIFFHFCRKYNIRWSSATAKERAFIEEISRVTYERERAIRTGRPVEEVRHSFAS